MSNGLLSRKGMIAILASCMFAVTACSDKKKVEDLEGENGRLKQQISQLENEKKTAEQKLAENEAKINELEERSASLNQELTDLKDADKTLADLARQIEEKRAISEELEETLERVRAEIATAEQDLQAARDAETAAIENGQRVTEEAQAKMDDANARIEKAIALEERTQALIEKKEALEARVDEAMAQWHELYKEHKLEAVFERLIDENRMNDSLTFQFSVVALNVSDKEIRTIRDRVYRVQKSTANIYQKDMKLDPEEKDVNERIVKFDKKVADNPAKTYKMASRRVLNDSFLVKTTGTELRALRNELQQMSADRRAVFMVPRLVEKLSLSMVMRVQVNQGDNVVEVDMKDTIEVSLNEPTEVPVDLSKPIDVTKPMNQMFPKDQCANFDAACMTALKNSGMLNVKTETLGWFGEEVVLKDYLASELWASADQTRKDYLAVENGFDNKTFGNQVAASLMTRSCVNTVDRTVEDCTKEKKLYERRPTIEKITLEFAVNQIQDLPYTGYIPVDFAMNERFRKLALNISKGQLHIQLPIEDNRTVSLNVESRAYGRVIQDYGVSRTDEDRELELSRTLSEKESIYKSFGRALR